MTPLSFDARKVAQRLLEDEAGGQREPDALASAVNRACAKLHGELVNLVGPGGVHALVGRALHLAQREFPFLGGVVPEEGPAGCLKGLEEVLREQDTAEAGASVVAVLAHLIGLLVSFLGHELGLYPVRKIWPGSTLDNLTFHSGETTEGAGG